MIYWSLWDPVEVQWLEERMEEVEMVQEGPYISGT